MNIELLFHGVPYGHDFFGPAEDRSYADTFYKDIGDARYMHIEIRNVGTNRYAYYHYLAYSTEQQKIKDNHGRSGAYFGMSLRMDVYCDDYVRLYNVLDTTFSKCILGKVLEAEGDNLKFCKASFNEFTSELKYATDHVVELFKLSILQTSILPLTTIPIASHGAFLCNLYDYSSAQFTDLLKKNGKLKVSPYFTARATLNAKKEAEQKLANLNERIAIVHADMKKVKDDFAIREQKLQERVNSEHQRAVDAQKEADKFKSKYHELYEKIRPSKKVKSNSNSSNTTFSSTTTSQNGEKLNCDPVNGKSIGRIGKLRCLNRFPAQLIQIATFILVLLITILTTIMFFRRGAGGEACQVRTPKSIAIGTDSANDDDLEFNCKIRRVVDAAHSKAESVSNDSHNQAISRNIQHATSKDTDKFMNSQGHSDSPNQGNIITTDYDNNRNE